MAQWVEVDDAVDFKAAEAAEHLALSLMEEWDLPWIWIWSHVADEWIAVAADLTVNAEEAAVDSVAADDHE